MAQQVNIDYGQAEIAAFKQQAEAAAQSGHFLFDSQVVDDLVRLYDHLIEDLNSELKRIQAVYDVTSFGGFPSTQQLANGFNNKARDFGTTLAQLIEGAMRMQEAVLLAGGKTTEAEAKNTQAIQFSAQALGTEKSA
ncbi:hypothetical protein [Nocardia transvalensis]|uniref:hypothetical protein n=1 Tax=Nocardia transvalensis TaxID=37333 RepID=UPI001895A55E|nr:hypothetical protein [Nocardia transvalensis]MBF6333356.1 hypothetical protein [Nocardia transvalensis]